VSERPDPREQAAEYLQTAALEAIKAVRAFLDIAESLVKEPETAAVVGRAFAEAAASVLRPVAASSTDDEADEPRDRGVRRIDLD